MAKLVHQGANNLRLRALRIIRIKVAELQRVAATLVGMLVIIASTAGGSTAFVVVPLVVVILRRGTFSRRDERGATGK